MTEISGFCIRQASVTDRAYGVYLKLDSQRKIVPGSLNCQCDYGVRNAPHKI